MSRRAPAALFAAALIVLAAQPLAATAKAPKPKKPIEGTWTFVDQTPDLTYIPNDAGTCDGDLPPGPNDVNTQELTVKRSGMLTITGHNLLDWAMELQDADGNILAEADGAEPNTPEGVVAFVEKGTYIIEYCNMTGEPEITADYLFE